MTPLPVRFQDVFDKLKVALSDETLYLNRQSGALQLVRESSVAGLCDVDEEAIPEKERAAIQKIRYIITSSEWVPLPGFIHEADFAVLGLFAESLGDRPQQQRLQALIKRSFSHPILDFLEEQALEEDWFLFRRRQFYQRLQQCLKQSGLTLVETLEIAKEPRE